MKSRHSKAMILLSSRSIAIQSFWKMHEMKRVKETSPFARVAKSNEHPKLQSTNTINFKKFHHLFVNINKYQLSISFLAHLCDGPGGTWLRPDAHLLLRPSQISFSAMAGVRPLHHRQGERPWHSPRRPSLFRSPSR